MAYHRYNSLFGKIWPFVLLIGLMSRPAHSQNGLFLQGRVTDGATGRPIAGLSVVIRKLNTGTRTDSSGAYRLSVPAGNHTVIYSAVGYSMRYRYVAVTTADVTVDVTMNPDVRQLEEVTVTSQAPDRNVSATQMSVVRLDVKNLKNIPVVFGEVDVLKALTLQPGVTTVGEGASGFNVRGGRTDQNLVLLDGAPLFNTSHLLGFLSNLNTDAIQDVTLYKGGIPAVYGGRLSSLLLMNTKTGNSDRLTVTTGVGLLTSRVLAEGPLTRNRRLTFLAGGRIAYPNFLLRLFPAPTNQNRAFFYDFNGRLTYALNDKSRISATIYHSYDDFKFPEDTLYGWQSTLATLRWSQTLTPRLSLNGTVSQSDYRFRLDGLSPTNEYRFRSTIRQRDGRLDFQWTPTGSLASGVPRHRLDFGASVTAYRLLPGSISPLSDASNVTPLTLESEFAREWAGYLSEEWNLRPWLSVGVGVRYVHFRNVGPGQVFSYPAGEPRSRETISDTLTYGSDRTLASYGGWEPRLTVRIGTGSLSSVKLSYSRTRQFLHLISNTTAISPVDFWKVSDPFVPPQVADQWAVGYFRNFSENRYETSVELYYKELTDLVEYKNGATLLLNPAIETDLLRAQGRAYGVEVSIQKMQGILTGLLAYTYARTWARVGSAFATEQINGGAWYPSSFDRPHNLTVSTQWKWKRGWIFGSNFIYTSGRPTTYPDGTYRLNGVLMLDYSRRNADRIPDYHRLDVSFTKDTRRTPTQPRYSTWSISFYNVYARKNPYSIYFRGENSTSRSYRLSVFGSIIPSLNWTYTF